MSDMSHSRFGLYRKTTTGSAQCCHMLTHLVATEGFATFRNLLTVTAPTCSSK